MFKDKSDFIDTESYEDRIEALSFKISEKDKELKMLRSRLKQN
jgi:hypothetical protein